MANCVRCAKKDGGFSFRTINPTTGRCTECDSEVQERLARFKKYFQQLSETGNFAESHWRALEKLASEDAIPIQEALAFARDNVVALICSVLENSQKSYERNPSESDVNFVRRSLAVPDYYVQELDSVVPSAQIIAKNEKALGKGNAAIICIKCGAGIVGPSSAAHFSCPTCGFVAAIRRCSFCGKAVHIQQSLWGRRVKCLSCGQENSWNSWNRREVTFAELSKNYSAAPETIADPSRRIVGGMVIGASGYSLPVRVGCKLEFDSDQVII